MRKFIFISIPTLVILTGLFFVSYQTSATVNGSPSDTTAAPSVSGRFFYKGLASPLDMDFTQVAGDDRIFVTEKGGSIRITGVNYETPFLDISEKVHSQGEKGMLGMTFDPDFANNNYFYVFYNGPFDESDPPKFSSYIERYTVSDDEPNFADEDSGTVIVQFTQQSEYHNGGNLVFGPDGYLYIGVGDDNQRDAVADLNTFHGKILRIDVDPTTVGNTPSDCSLVSGNYSIPADNPFVGQSACEEVWAYGMRNPWRFNFDSVTSDMYMGDVGESRTEELNFQPASSTGGENYGWPLFEGSECAEGVLQTDCDNLANHTPPIFDYPHSAGGGSITGGFVYRGSTYPNLYGHYIFGDFTNSQIWTAINDGGSWEITDHGPLIKTGLAFLSAFGMDPAGEVYAVRFTDGETGSILRVIEDYGLEIELEGPSAVEPGSNIEYSVVVTNTGAMTATNITVENDLPANTNYVSGGELNGSTVSWTIPTLGITETVSVSWITSPLTETVVNANYRVSAEGNPVITGTKTITTIVESGIIGRLFEDLNQNGIDESDPGIPNVDLILWKNEACDGAVDTVGVGGGDPPDYVATGISGADGSFRFDVPDDAICYLVQVDLADVPEALRDNITLQNQGQDDSNDSDIDPNNGWTSHFTVPVPAVKAGFYDPAKPTPTPAPTATPIPTATPVPTATPMPENEAIYLPLIVR
ncbi:MAG: PQQ-dependent sugar dehydrogenase [Anaerolineae bacterium]